ncbi:hypothetical protein ES332_A05G428800v1 [Gossypium tomentosum]|uniref:RNase H type-1 domain-containing protein n=1 Tax=Gossypium tomentosum TaxID=34277 RepID=A0A5D2QSG9_GOSTO|nr:hypothetical protein ES332_A05G428800v1 [Gossypium tomentosum]
MNVFPPVSRKIEIICKSLKEYGHELLYWDKLADRWCKLNTEGSWFRDRQGIIRDMHGRWVSGFSISNCSIDLAELWGLLDDIHLAWNTKFNI